MALNHLFNDYATEWTTSFDGFIQNDHIDVDLRGVKLKNITVTLADDGLSQKLGDKIKELADVKKTLNSYNTDRMLIQAQIDVLEEMLRD